MSRPAEVVERKISFSALDWVVTRKEQSAAVDSLDGSSDLSSEIEYEVHEEEGGSGGNGVRLRACVESGGRFIVLDSVVQPDSGGDDEFHAEWAILPTLRWASPK